MIYEIYIVDGLSMFDGESPPEDPLTAAIDELDKLLELADSAARMAMLRDAPRSDGDA